jgi:hypothetical protein
VYHAFYNLIFFSFAFLNFSTSANYQVKNSDHSFSMHKADYSNLPDEEVKNTDYSFSMNIVNHTNNQLNGFQIVPGKVIFENYKLTEVLEIVLKKPRKYFLNTDFGDMYVNVNYITKQIPRNPNSSLRIVSENMQKTLKVTFTRQLISKDVWELYIADPIQYRKAVLPILPSERHYSLCYLGEILDRRNKDVYIMCNDSVHQFYLNQNLKWPLFAEIRTGWKEKYGLGFRKVKREVEFMIIK